jgi:hypothetical protein
MRRETLTAVINLCGGGEGGGFPGNGLTKSGDTSRHIERGGGGGGLENDSECTSIHVHPLHPSANCKQHPWPSPEEHIFLRAVTLGA